MQVEYHIAGTNGGGCMQRSNFSKWMLWICETENFIRFWHDCEYKKRYSTCVSVRCTQTSTFNVCLVSQWSLDCFEQNVRNVLINLFSFFIRFVHIHNEWTAHKYYNVCLGAFSVCLNFVFSHFLSNIAMKMSADKIYTDGKKTAETATIVRSLTPVELCDCKTCIKCTLHDFSSLSLLYTYNKIIHKIT